MKKIRILLGICLLGLFTSCKTTKTVDCWVVSHQEKIPYHDTLTLHELHYHYCTMEGIPLCVWIQEEKIAYTDTLILNFYQNEKRKPCDCF